jgi:ATP-binding cassette subfamily B (MDR/TAP) protein 7
LTIELRAMTTAVKRRSQVASAQLGNDLVTHSMFTSVVRRTANGCTRRIARIPPSSQSYPIWTRTNRPVSFASFHTPSTAKLGTRAFRHLASGSDSEASKSSAPAPAPAPAPAHATIVPEGDKPAPAAPVKAPVKDKDVVPTNAEQRRRDWIIIRQLATNIWPKNDWNTKGRILLGLGLLVGGKVSTLFFPRVGIHRGPILISVVIPLVVERAGSSDLQGYCGCSQCGVHCRHDCLRRRWKCHRRLYVSFSVLPYPIQGHSPNLPTSTDGLARIGATLFGELLNTVFASVGQRAVRKVARETFEHILNLDLRFHLGRQTGGLTRAIDRGTKYVELCSCYENND